MAALRPRALTETSLATQRLYFLTSTLLAFVLVLGIDISEMSVFGVEVSFTQAQLLLVLLIGNVYFNIAFTVQSWRDLREQERVFDIATQDELVGKPAYDRLEAAIDDIGKSTALDEAAKARLIDSFAEMARAVAEPLNLEESEAQMTARMERTGATIEAVITAIGTLARPADAVLAGRLNAHVERMMRRRQIYVDVREEGLRHAEGGSSASYLVPVVAGILLNLVVVLALAAPQSYATVQGWLAEIDSTYFAPRSETEE